MGVLQMLGVDDVEFLEAHEAQLWFKSGSKVGLEWRRPDGLRVQCSGWTVGECLNTARKMLSKWRDSSPATPQNDKGPER